MIPLPETPEKDAPAGCAGFVAIFGGSEPTASGAGTTKTIPHVESRPRSAVDPRRDDVSYARPVVLASPVRGKRILIPPAPADRAAGGAAGSGIGSGSRSCSATPKKRKRRDAINAVAPRPLKSSRRGQSDTPGPAHSVAEYLANTQRGREAVASISEGTGGWLGVGCMGESAEVASVFFTTSNFLWTFGGWGEGFARLESCPRAIIRIVYRAEVVECKGLREEKDNGLW